jgi:hypothetical protein
VKRQNNKRIYRDKNGREYQKEQYFIGGKMKFRRVYVIDGMPADEFYERNAGVIEMVIDGNFHLVDGKNDLDNCCEEPNPSDKEDMGDLPF